MTDTKTVVAVGGFFLDVFLEAHANAEARHTGRPRQARGPEFGEVLKQAGGSSSLLDLRGTLATFGGTATAADGGSPATPTPTPTPTPTLIPPPPAEVARNLEAELATVFAEADAARARLDEARRADEHMQMLVELRQFMGEKLGALERGLSDLNARVQRGLSDLDARVTRLEAAKCQQTSTAAAPVAAASGEAGANAVAPVLATEVLTAVPSAVPTIEVAAMSVAPVAAAVGDVELAPVPSATLGLAAPTIEAAMSQASDRLTVPEGSK